MNFKKGDLILATDTVFNYYTKGKIYEVLAARTNSILMEYDNGRFGQFIPDDFILAAPQTIAVQGSATPQHTHSLTPPQGAPAASQNQIAYSTLDEIFKDSFTPNTVYVKSKGGIEYLVESRLPVMAPMFFNDYGLKEVSSGFTATIAGDLPIFRVISAPLHPTIPSATAITSFRKELNEVNKKCECGSHACGSNAHSQWCPLYG